MSNQVDDETFHELADSNNHDARLTVSFSLNNMCRFCLSKQEDSINIFDSNSAIEMITLLELLLNTNISKTDQLPQCICQDCQKIVKMILNFKAKCHKTDTILKKYSNCVLQNDSAVTVDISESERLDLADEENSEIASFNPLTVKSKNLNNLTNIQNNIECKKATEPTKKSKTDLRRQSARTAHELLNRQKCSECDAECRNVGALIKHRLGHHGSKKFQCLECGNGFTTLRGLRFHLRIHSGDRREVCSLCGKSFTDPRTRIKHELRHRSKMPHACEACPRSFESRASLERHMNTSHPGPGVAVISTHQCTVCARSYMHPHSLKVHMRKHNGSRPYACNHCERKFTNGTSLAAHKRSHNIFAASGHRAEKKSSILHSCSKCPRIFKMSSALASHMLTHTGIKNYMCANCGVCVARSSELAVHMKTHAREAESSANERAQDQSPASNVAQDLRVAISTRTE